MAEPESLILAWMRKLDEKLDALGGTVNALRAETSERFGRIEDELLVISGIALRLEAREIETTGLKALHDRTQRRLAQVEARLAALEGRAG